MAQEEQAIKIIEREYVIPLRKEWRKVPRYKRANKAVKAIKEFLVRHMKIYDRDLEKVKIDRYLNEFIWMRSIKKPPIRVKVKAIKEIDSDKNEIVRVTLIDFPEKLKYKKIREEKIKKEAIEKSEKKKKLKQEEKEEMKEETGKGQDKQEEPEKKADKDISEKVQKESSKQRAKKEKHTTKIKSKEPKHQKRKALAK